MKGKKLTVEGGQGHTTLRFSRLRKPRHPLPGGAGGACLKKQPAGLLSKQPARLPEKSSQAPVFGAEETSTPGSRVGAEIDTRVNDFAG